MIDTPAMVEEISSRLNQQYSELLSLMAEVQQLPSYNGCAPQVQRDGLQAQPIAPDAVQAAASP